MPKFSNLRIAHFLIIAIFSLTSCKTIENLPGGNAREISPDPRERVKKNLEEGRGFRLDNLGNSGKGGNFMFASANELWRASLDTLDFMPLSSVNYSGGIIITDWYSESSSPNESIKISIRFLTNEVRSDALDIKVFNRVCKSNNMLNCKIIQTDGLIVSELKKKILKTAMIYKEENKKKK